MSANLKPHWLYLAPLSWTTTRAEQFTVESAIALCGEPLRVFIRVLDMNAGSLSAQQTTKAGMFLLR